MKKFDFPKLLRNTLVSKWFDAFPFVGFVLIATTEHIFWAGLSLVFWGLSLALRTWSSDYYE